MDLLTQFHAALIRNGQLEDLFMELNKEDISGINLVMKLMKKYNLLKVTPLMRKSEEKSSKLREFGNTMFTGKQFDNALIAYNAALLFAPRNSKAYKLAFGNRSALYFHQKKYEACIADINTCLALNPAVNLAAKLTQRKEDSITKMALQKDSTKRNVKKENKDVTALLTLESKRNKLIPFAIDAVSIVEGEYQHRVVATKEIKVGQVISDEVPFMAELKSGNYYLCCYYCFNFSDNLIPCDDCVSAMFCNNDCKEKCHKEFHYIDCKLQTYLSHLSTTFRLSLRVLIKAKSLFNSWDDLIAAVEKVKQNPSLVGCPISNDFENICKMFINSRERRPLGKKLGRATSIVLLVHNLAENTNFIKSTNDYKVIDFIFEFLYNLTLTNAMSPLRTVKTTACNIKCDKVTYDVQGMGVYAFYGLIKHACNPNVISVDIKDRKVLVALQPIQPGDELFMCKLVPYYELQKSPRERQLYQEYNIICDCKACMEEWYPREYDSTALLTEQKNISAYLSYSGILEADYAIVDLCLKNYQKICESASAFKDKPTFILNIAIQKILTIILHRFQNELSHQFGTNLTEKTELAMNFAESLSR